MIRGPAGRNTFSSALHSGCETRVDVTVVPFKAPKTVQKLKRSESVALTAPQLTLIARALGEYGEPGEIRRDYVALRHGSREAAIAMELTRADIMRCEAGPMWGGQYVYVVTDHGRQLFNEFADLFETA